MDMTDDQETIFLTRVQHADSMNGALFIGTKAWDWWLKNKKRFPKEAKAPDERSEFGYFGEVPLVPSKRVPEGDFSVRSKNS